MSDTFRERLRRLFEGKPPMQATPAECPLPDCSTCLPEPEPLDVVAEQQRAQEITYASAWLIEHYPDVWYAEKPGQPTLRDVAPRLVELDRAVRAGRVPL